MPKLWITYSWKDNQQQEIDYVAQELEKAGIEVKLDKWSLIPGQRLWEQIDRFIASEHESDAWMIYATENSLGSEPCKEEIAYALDRALSKRGEGFPVIALFAGAENLALFPAALRTRLCVSLEGRDWKDRVEAAVNRRAPQRNNVPLRSYVFATHETPDGIVFEIRPRAGVWSNFYVGVLAAEINLLTWLQAGRPGRIPLMGTGMYGMSSGPFECPDGKIYQISTRSFAGASISPGVSAYCAFKSVPSMLFFGDINGEQFISRLGK